MTTRPPAADRDETIVDDLHGTPVADPYRALEDTDAPATRAWIERQNAATKSWLDETELRQPFRALLAARWDWPKLRPPVRRGERWFQLRNPGMDPQPTLWVSDAPDAEGRPLLDPASFSDDATTSLTGLAISDDGSLVAHGISEGGSDWMTWRVRDVATGEDRLLEDGTVETVRRAKFTGAEWLPDASGFLYGGYPRAGDDDGASLLDTNHGQQLLLHVLGTDPADDVVVMDAPDDPTWGFGATVTHDGRWVLVEVWEGTQPHTRWMARALPAADEADVTIAGAVDWDDRSGFTWLFDDRDGARSHAGEVGGELLFLDDGAAPLGQVLGLRPEVTDDGPVSWRRRVVVPEGDDALERAKVVGGRLLVLTLHHAVHRLAVVDPDPAEIAAGTAARWVELPDLGTVEDWAGGHDDADAYVTFTTFLVPPVVLRIGVRDAEPTAVAVADPDTAPAGLDPDRFTTDQVFVEHDGETGLDGPVRVPVFLVRRRDLEPDGETPSVLWGYGGFNIPVTPGVRPGWLAWVESGGLLAVACLRGGGEYGRAWHDDGRLANKQHVFDDAIAVAEWLTGTGAATGDGTGPRLVDRDGRSLPWDTPWTRPDRLGVEGRSNGGLLVGALMTQRPDLWGSCVPEVGVLDLVRFHTFTIGWGWKSDYGDPDDADEFPWAWGYSPLHAITEGTDYPATLVTTGDHDDRVVPGHSFKFTAALQHAQRDLPIDDDRPALIRVDTSAGHGAGKPTAKLIDERADVLAFHARALDAEALLEP